MFIIDAARFERLVGEALDSLPSALGEMMENIVVMVEDAHPDEDLLGLYEGVPLTERDNYGMVLPDKITLFQDAIESVCDTDEQIVDEVRTTVVHELAHHFGIEDDRLDELGV